MVRHHAALAGFFLPWTPVEAGISASTGSRKTMAIARGRMLSARDQDADLPETFVDMKTPRANISSMR